METGTEGRGDLPKVTHLAGRENWLPSSFWFPEAPPTSQSSASLTHRVVHVQDVPLARFDGTVIYSLLDPDLQLPFALGPRGRGQGAQADGQYCQDPVQPHVSAGTDPDRPTDREGGKGMEYQQGAGGGGR